MPVKASQNFIRSFRLTVFVENGAGEPRAEDIVIKHRPVSDEWLEKWTEITAREEKELQAEIDTVTVDYQQELERLAKEAERLGDSFDHRGAKDILSKKLDLAHAKLKEKRQKSLLVRQLACDTEEEGTYGLLIDIDHLDDHGNPIKPTQAFLHTRDRALLEEIRENIEKKLFPGRANGKR